MARDIRPPSGWQIEKSLSLWRQLQESFGDDMSTLPDEQVATLPEASAPKPEVMLQRAIDAAIWSDLRAAEATELAKRMTARRHRYEERSQKIRQVISDLLQVLDLKAAEGELGAADLVKGRPAVVITAKSVDELPADFKKTTITTVPDKVAIGEALKAGKPVEGAELSNPGQVLRLTPF